MNNSRNILGSENGFLSSTPKELERVNGILEEIVQFFWILGDMWR